jgi:hypothetical protein
MSTFAKVMVGLVVVEALGTLYTAKLLQRRGETLLQSVKGQQTYYTWPFLLALRATGGSVK